MLLGHNVRVWESIGPFISQAKHIEQVADWPGYKLLVYNGGDIGSTAEVIASTVFNVWGFDGVVIGMCYLGTDAIEPFTRYAGKDVFVAIQPQSPFGNMITQDGDTLSNAFAKKLDAWSCRTLCAAPDAVETTEG